MDYIPYRFETQEVEVMYVARTNHFLRLLYVFTKNGH